MKQFRRIRKALLVLAALSAASPITIERSGAIRTAEACAQEPRCCFEDKSLCIEGNIGLFHRYLRTDGKCESPAY